MSNLFEKIANPELASALNEGGVSVPNLTGLAQAGINKALEQDLKVATEMAQNILMGLNDRLATTVDIIAGLKAELKKAEDNLAETKLVKSFVVSTNNFFPAMKHLKMPYTMSASSKSQHLDSIPDGWTPPAPAAPTATEVA